VDVNLVYLLVLALAVARLTRMVTEDKIMLPIRQWVLRRSGEDGWFFYLVNCPFCMSVWISVFVTSGTFFWHDNRVWQFILIGLAVSYISGRVVAGLNEVNINHRRDD
jgi:hypothetical protein